MLRNDEFIDVAGSWSGLALPRGRPTAVILDPSGMLQRRALVAAPLAPRAPAEHVARCVRAPCAISTRQSVKTFEANDRLGYGFGAQDDLVGLAGGAGILTTTRASAAKQGMKPTIVPNMKHQVASIVVCPLLI